MENMEIEKKYTIKKLPENLETYPCKIIEQAYLNTAPVVRVRRSDNTYYLTYKGSGLMAREEYNSTKPPTIICLKKRTGMSYPRKDMSFPSKTHSLMTTTRPNPRQISVSNLTSLPRLLRP